MSRKAVAVLSINNLLHNISIIKKIAPQARIVASVKGNAYGHGLRSVSLRLQNHIHMLSVSSMDDALTLRKIGIQIPIILTEGVYDPRELLIASAERLEIIFHSEMQVHLLENLPISHPIRGWLKIDTGMGFLDFESNKSETIYNRLLNNRNILKPIGLASDLACTNEPDNPLNQLQFKAFSDFFKRISSYSSPECGLFDSSAIFTFPQQDIHLIQAGIALYGASPFLNKTAKDLNLKPVMTLQSRLISKKTMTKGSTVGYGATYVCPEDMPIGIIAFGYGDGYPRCLHEGTPVLVNNTKSAIIGRVSMDMMAVDLRSCPEASIGDPVILWGEGLSIEEVAQFTPYCANDLFTHIQNRVNFQWI